MPASKAATPSVRFRVDEFDVIAASRGLRYDTDKAKFLGVKQSSYSRITRGRTKPSEHFVAAVLHRFSDDPEITFERLFEVVEVVEVAR